MLSPSSTFCEISRKTNVFFSSCLLFCFFFLWLIKIGKFYVVVGALSKPLCFLTISFIIFILVEGQWSKENFTKFYCFFQLLFFSFHFSVIKNPKQITQIDFFFVFRFLLFLFSFFVFSFLLNILVVMVLQTFLILKLYCFLWKIFIVFL